MAACAAPSPPLPPSLELPTPVTDLHAVRKGNSVVLTWTLPLQTTDGEGIRFLGPTRICRSQLDVLTECGQAVAELTSLQLDTIANKATVSAPQRVSARYVDPLPADWMRNPTASVAYAIESLNTSHRSAGLSNLVHVPAASTQPPPADFAAQLTEAGVVLTWSGPFLSVPGPDVAPHYLYRVYRVSADAPKPVLVGEVLEGINDKMRLVDNSFAWEKTYDYRINLTTRTHTGTPHPCADEVTGFSTCSDPADVEGEDSPPITIVAHDVFPPTVPTALQAVFSGAGQQPFIDLTWNANTDADLIGYNVYRRDASSQPVRINRELVRAPAFRDPTVVAGRTYFYAVSAVDARSNESSRSQEASETVPSETSN